MSDHGDNTGGDTPPEKSGRPAWPPRPPKEEATPPTPSGDGTSPPSRDNQQSRPQPAGQQERKDKRGCLSTIFLALPRGLAWILKKLGLKVLFPAIGWLGMQIKKQLVKPKVHWPLVGVVILGLITALVYVSQQGLGVEDQLAQQPANEAKHLGYEWRHAGWYSPVKKTTVEVDRTTPIWKAIYGTFPYKDGRVICTFADSAEATLAGADGALHDVQEGLKRREVGGLNGRKLKGNLPALTAQCTFFD